MTYFPVNSSHIKEVGYENGTMHVRFRTGDLYRYENVGPKIYSGLLKAPSPGSFFHRFVRDRFPGQQVKPQ